MKSAQVQAFSGPAHGRWLLLALGLLLAWDATGWDLGLARLSADGGAFPKREHWLLTTVLHEDARWLAWGVIGWLVLGLAWPTGILRRIPLAPRLQWLASVGCALLLVNLIKHFSPASCPWDLAEFGGHARYLGHWALSDGGPGRCFPAGHASAGFAFIGGYFALRRHLPGAARRVLAAALGAGLLLGLAQQLRGAHFMSHTLWTAWLCWGTAWAADAAASFARRIHDPVILPSHENP